MKRESCSSWGFQVEQHIRKNIPNCAKIDLKAFPGVMINAIVENCNKLLKENPADLLYMQGLMI